MPDLGFSLVVLVAAYMYVGVQTLLKVRQLGVCMQNYHVAFACSFINAQYSVILRVIHCRHVLVIV